MTKRKGGLGRYPGKRHVKKQRKQNENFGNLRFNVPQKSTCSVKKMSFIINGQKHSESDLFGQDSSETDSKLVTPRKNPLIKSLSIMIAGKRMEGPIRHYESSQLACIVNGVRCGEVKKNNAMKITDVFKSFSCIQDELERKTTMLQSKSSLARKENRGMRRKLSRMQILHDNEKQRNQSMQQSPNL